ncbi:MAG: Transmembrane protein 63C [Candelina mexicana]|nr:MAG: Transmembrane protein 63C [Candelina mexicana]
MASSMDTSLHGLTKALLRRVDESQDQNIGKAQNKDSSLSALVSTLVPVLVVAAVMTLLFLILRRSQRRQYAPRTYLGALREQERSPDLPKGLFNWIGSFYAIPDTFILNHSSLDGYLLLRFLKIVTAIAFVGCCITWPVLFPVNATGHGGQVQLNILSFSNVVDKNRYYAHVFIAWIFYGFVMLMVTREHIFYINLRQAYLLSPLYSQRMSSRTVLFTSVPDEFLDEAKLRRMFGNKLKNVWIATDTKDVEDLVKERDKTALKLEGAEIKLTKLANAARIKAHKKSRGRDDEATITGAGDGESGSVASRWLKPKQRPTHRTKFLIGKKVDTIDWARSELSTLIPQVDALQNAHRAGEAKYVNSVFVEFYSQAEAQAAFQMVAHHQALHMAPRFIGISPNEVIWKNLRIKWWERIIRNIATIAFVCALIIFWSIPVALVGIISHIDYIVPKVPFLKFIYKIPPVILGVVTGLLPTIMLAVLMALLPVVLRLAAKWGGMPSLSRIELRTQNFYFAFQVVQVFLVTTLSSAASASVVSIIQAPTSVTGLLAENLPKASTFYISYFILQGLAISSGALLQIAGLIISRVLGKILDKSPRKMYNRWATLSGLGWGTIFPVYTMLGVIAITYAPIAPLVLGFATIGMYLIYFAYRYNLLFVFNANIDTQGLVYPRALQGLTVGVYLGQLCLIGLFGIKAAPGPIVLMVAALIFTALYHISLNSAFGPLLTTLPKSLEAEEEALLSVEDGDYSPDGPMANPKGIHAVSAKNGTRDISSSSTGPVNKDLPAVPHKKPSFFMKWLRPDKYHDYHTLRRLVPRNFAEIVYSPETERDAYYNPAIKSPTPLLWIPRDPAGVSRQEVKHTSRITPITDEGAHFDEKNKIVWDAEQTGGRPPIWEPKTYF